LLAAEAVGGLVQPLTAQSWHALAASASGANAKRWLDAPPVV